MPPNRVPIVDGKKICSMCGEWVPLELYKRSAETYAGYRSICIACRKVKEKTVYRQDQRKVRDRVRKYTYGITREDWDGMFDKQEGKCPICSSTLDPGVGTRQKRKGYAHIDHCHKTGKIRGLLCHMCNSGLGLFLDEPDRLRKAIEYLESF